MLKYFKSLTLFVALILGSCQLKTNTEQPLYQAVLPDDSGIDFGNYLALDDSINFFTFGYVYSGAGVAVGDINNDGLQDLFFVGNMVENCLYLNEGNLQFKDITRKAGLQGDGRWDSGATMADVNGDGFLDIYVSVSGMKNADCRNLLYINNKDLTFTESAQSRGVADNGHSTQTTFFDYDKDGDLDAYVANYPPAAFYSPHTYYRNRMDSVQYHESDHLFQNDGQGYFKDVTRETELLRYGLSLSAAAGDFDQDGWTDLYVSNDFATPDYFYLNNGDGTFKETIKETTKHTAFYGMGIDVADFNNDGRLDIIQAEMNPADNFRSKANMGSMNAPLFWEAVDLGFHYQYMQNVLQVNQGKKENGMPFFSDVSRITGLSSTDWSWASLFIDMDNDGWKDIFISNGIRRDINNKDFFKRVTKPAFLANYGSLVELAEGIPSANIPNYAFRNDKDLSFTDMSEKWGLDFEGFSHGASYSDLDNDGDLDIIINNVDSVALIFENRANTRRKNNFLRFKLEGPEGNRFGLGTKIQLEHQGQRQFQELTLTRGYQSSVEPIVHFGIGTATSADKVTITWPDGRQQTLADVPANQVLVVNYSHARSVHQDKKSPERQHFTEITGQKGIHYKHTENEYDDFGKEPLLPHKTSQFGPGLAVGDINGDGWEDFYIGGAADAKGQLFIQQSNETFKTLNGPWEDDHAYEDMGALMFDADGDNDLDLYIVSGGNEFAHNSPDLQDRLYINMGKGQFQRNISALPEMITSGSCVTPIDFDEDGDVDLFVGGRIIPGQYPLPPRSYLLENKSTFGNILFEDVTEKIAPALLNPGLVTSAVSTDFDRDGDKDLVVTGEWMPISFFRNDAGFFSNVTASYGFENSTGWWFSIIASDFDEDGDEDLVAGNLGLNYKYQASEEESFDVYAYDYDENNKLDIVLGYYFDGIQYPVRGRQCSAEQIPGLEFKFKNYTAFASATLEEVYTEAALEASVHYQAKTFASSYIENLGNNQFRMKKLPNQAQISSINGILAGDFNADGYQDILTVGNLFVAEVETPRNDAFYGLLLAGDGKGSFGPVEYAESGFYAPHDAKAISLLKTAKKDLVLVANNNDSLQVFRFE